MQLQSLSRRERVLDIVVVSAFLADEGISPIPRRNLKETATQEQQVPRSLGRAILLGPLVLSHFLLYDYGVLVYQYYPRHHRDYYW